MKAVVSRDGAGPEQVRLEEVPERACGPDEVVVEVKATALNRADLLQTWGRYPAPPGVPAEIPGLEYAGVVKQLGARVTKWKVGDAVMGLVAGGAWAERLIAHEREVLRAPPGVPLTDCAAIPEAFMTAFDALVLQAGLTRGHDVLIHAVTSGVGTAAVQLCDLFGARAIGTGRNAQKLARLALPTALHVTNTEFAARVKQATGGKGCDVALELVGGDYLPDTIEAMAPGGTVMLVGLVAGVSAEVPLAKVLSRRLRVIGTTLRARPLEEKITLARHFERQVWPAFDSGALKPVIDETLPMSRIAEGLARMAANDTFGKLVLTW